MNIEIRYAIGLSIFEVIRLFAEYYTGLQGVHLPFAWGSSLLLILVIIWMIYSATKANLSTTTGSEKPVLLGAKTGFFLMLLSSIAMAGIHYLFFKYFNPAYFEALIGYAEKAGVAPKQASEAYHLSAHLRLFVFYPSYGLLIGAISGWLLGKNSHRTGPVH